MPENPPKNIVKRALEVSAPISGFSIALFAFYNSQWRYGFILLTITFLAILLRTLWKFAGRTKDNIEKILHEEKAPRVAQWIVDTSERYLIIIWWTLTSRFRSKYYKSLIYKYRTYRTLGLSVRGKFSFDFEEIFVPLRVDIESLEKISSSMIQPESQKVGLDVWDFLAAMSKQTAYQRIAIIGAPGSGKTTLLEHVSLTYAQNKQRSQHRKSPKLIPILITLRDIKNQISSDGTPSLGELIERQESIKKLKPRRGWFEQKLKKKKCLVMLDGLDEVADPVERQNVSYWVNAQMEIYPNTPFIVTSRPFGYKSAPIEQIRVVLEAQPLSRSQMERFVRNWYVQSEVMHQLRKVDAGIVEMAYTKAEDLITRLRHNADLLVLAFNPLLLTMIATVHDNNGALPRSRVELYNEICDVLLGRRQEAKRLPINLASLQKKAVLQVLALSLMQKRTREFTLSDGALIIEDILSTVSSKGQTPEQFLERAEKVSGILIEKEIGLYEFAHKSFQEYLAAVQIKETNQEQVLIANVNDQWWEETIRLYSAQSDATKLIRTAINSRTIYTYTLAYDCLEDGARVLPEVRDQLHIDMNSMIEGSDRKFVKLAAEVRLSRRLKKLLPTSNVVFDSTFITAAEYQLFIDETKDKNVHNQPDHWHNFRFPSGIGDKPVLGMRIDSARGFCSWLTSRHKSPDYRYRLPTVSEASEHSTITNEIGFWSWEQKNAVLIGLNDSQLNEIKEQMLRAFDLDISNLTLNIPSDEIEIYYDYIKTRNIQSVFGKDVGNTSGTSVGFSNERLFESADLTGALKHVFRPEHRRFRYLPDDERVKGRISTLNKILGQLTPLKQSIPIHGFQVIFSTAFDRSLKISQRIQPLNIVRLSALISFLFWTWILEILQTSIDQISQKVGGMHEDHSYIEHKIKYKSQMEASFFIYAMTTIILERQSGQATPFEGIKIVKEWVSE